MSYFPEDIPFMSKEELRENGIRIPKDVTDTNVGNNSEIPNSSDAISRQWLLDCINDGWIKFDTDKDANRFIHLVRDIAPTIQPEKAQPSKEGTTSDLISRQAAIEIVDRYDKSHMILKGKPMLGAASIVIELEALPSAQPEQRWIPVSERLPRDGTWNIFTDGKNISVERYKTDAIDHFFPNGRWFQLEDVIAWMPLPKPFEGGTE